MKNWRDGDKPREKLLLRGASSLSDAELIAIVLNTGATGLDALTIAGQMLGEAGDLRTLLNRPGVLLCRNKGVGPAKYARLMASVELGRRYLGQFPRRGMQMTEPNVVRALLASRLQDREHETFVAIFLDNRHRLLHYEEMFHGTINSASVHPREVVRRALDCNAAALIVAHNHPSGIAEPSTADQRLTDRLQSALGLVEVRLLDHFIVGETEILSFTEKGLL